MEKLIITLLVLAVLPTLAVPAMAASPVKDYASAQDGDLLYTVNFTVTRPSPALSSQLWL